MTFNMWTWFTWYKNIETNEVIGCDVYRLYQMDDPDMEDWIEIPWQEAMKIKEQNK